MFTIKAALLLVLSSAAISTTASAACDQEAIRTTAFHLREAKKANAVNDTQLVHNRNAYFTAVRNRNLPGWKKDQWRPYYQAYIVNFRQKAAFDTAIKAHTYRLHVLGQQCLLPRT